ncbi:MAG: class I SAM-dependent methyltransferase [Clostridiales bacterium]|nr:class I SAM-dependent methyltransferase [Clostridiales bacterium]
MKKKIWDLYAPIYERAMRGDKRVYKFMYDRIPQVIQGKDVLEIATGPGLLAKHVAYAANKMIATDYSEGMIREAKKGSFPDNLTFEAADAECLPYDDNSFDAVIIANALHILPNPQKR